MYHDMISTLEPYLLMDLPTLACIFRFILWIQPLHFEHGTTDADGSGKHDGVIIYNNGRANFGH